MKNIAIVGLGTVGMGVYERLLLSNNESFKLKRIVVKDQHKIRPSGFEAYASSWQEVISDPSIDIVIELIDDELFAYQVAQETLRGKKSLISGNKKMLAMHIGELQQLAESEGVALFYEAAVCGGIPIILLLQQYFLGNVPRRIRTIANGTSNYMLSKMWETDKSFQEVLSLAQSAGFAEADPTDDLAGFDIRSKLVLMIWNAFNTHLNPASIPCFGIQFLQDHTVELLRSKALRLKLIGQVVHKEKGLLAFVIPEIINCRDTFFEVNNEQNIVEVVNDLSEEQLFQGKGAGRYPTTQAVLADLQAVLSNRRNAVNKLALSFEASAEQFIFFIDQNFTPKTVGVEQLKVGKNYTIVLASFATIKKLSEQLGDIFIAKISQEIFDEISV